MTGSADSVRKNPHVPVTPAQIAQSALEAHAAGAAILHIHVRNPRTGLASSGPALFSKVVQRIRERNCGLILNLTGGMGGALVLGPEHAPLEFGAGTDFVGPRERMAHVLDLLPEIASLDCGSLNFDEASGMTRPSGDGCATTESRGARCK